MFLQLQQESLLIGRKPAGFTEHYYTEWDDGLGREKISLFFVLSISSTQVPGSEVAKEAFQLLQDHFLDDLTGDPYDRFEAALREINGMVNEKEKDLGLKFIPNMNVLCGVIQKDMLFLSQRGEAQGYLVRKRHVSSITEGLYDEKNKEDLFQNIASGVLEVGDAVVLATGHLVQFVTPNDLSKIFSEQSLGEAGKELKDLLHADMEDQMAILAFEVLEKQEPSFSAAKKAKEEVDEPEISEEKKARIKEGIQTLHQWVSNRERFAFIAGLRSWPKKKLLQGILALVVIIVVGVGAMQFTGGKKRELANMQAKLDAAEENITQASTRGTFDKSEADLLLTEAETLAVEVLDSGLLGAQASQILDEIQVQRDFLDNVVHVTDKLTLLTDLSTAVTGTVLGVLDYEDKQLIYTEHEVYEVVLGELGEAIVVDPNLVIQSASNFPDQDNVVMLMSDGNLIEYKDGNSQLADTSDVEWAKGVSVGTYSNKVYILDAEAGQLWRYQRGSSAYGAGQAYVGEDVTTLQGAKSFAVDGNVWVLGANGEILKFYAGDAVPFYVNEAPIGTLEGANKLYTDLESNQIYILDPSKDRLLIYNKSTSTEDLTYDSQYLFEGLKGELKDFYVDKDRMVMVLVTDQALYEAAF